MVAIKENTKHYLDDFGRLEKQRAGREDKWFAPVRKAAISHFVEHGFPTLRDETWRLTPISLIAQTEFELADDAFANNPAEEDEPGMLDCASLTDGFLTQITGPRLVLVDGHYCPELSSPDSLIVAPKQRPVSLASLSTLMKRDAQMVAPHLARYADYRANIFTALNTALFECGAFVEIPKNAVVAEPIHLLHIATDDPDATPIAHFPRTLILVGANSQATIIENFIGIRTCMTPASAISEVDHLISNHDHPVYFTNSVTEVIVGDNAQLELYRLQQELEDALHIATLQIQLGRNAQVRSHAVSFGAALSRHQVNVVLDGEGAECTLNGLFVGVGEQYVDHELRIEHAQPHSNSRVNYKGVLTDHAHGIFNGRVIVRKNAQKTDAKQTNRNLLLSSGAQIDSNPQLEIFADDVKCTHAATIGQIDSDALFYLRSRGLTHDDARDLLVYAFASEIIDSMKLESVRTRLESLLLQRLQASSRQANHHHVSNHHGIAMVPYATNSKENL